MATPVPADLKPIAPFLQRASELTKADPVIAYWCNYYAVQQAISLGSKADESTQFLFALMDKLELTKEELATNEAVADDGAASVHVESFAVKVFQQADNEDRAGRPTRLTAKKFLAAANFLELLSIFGEMSIENRDKIKYSKWKAADIAKAFREGRSPVPGPAGGLPPGGGDEVSSQPLTAEETKELSLELTALGTTDGATPTTVTSPTLPSATVSPTPSYPFPQQPTTLPSATPSLPPSVPSFSLSSLPDASSSLFDEERPATPAFPSFLNTPTHEPSSDLTPSAPPALPDIPTTHQTQALSPPREGNGPAFPAAVFPQAPSVATQSPPLPPPAPAPVIAVAPPVLPPPPAPVVRTYVAPVPVLTRAPPAPLNAAEVPETLDPAVIGSIQKHCKWAISSLNYDDLVTARKELRAALALLGG